MGCKKIFTKILAFCLILIMLPICTMADTDSTYCGLDEHTHTGNCYNDRLVCNLEEVESHTHNDECYTFYKDFVCGKKEGEVHKHTGKCYEDQLVLVCRIPESPIGTAPVLICRLPHRHTAACYYQEVVDHMHGRECYKKVKVLICKEEEGVPHWHNDDCVEVHKELTCGKEEAEGHTHTKKCYRAYLVCGKTEHTHSATCYVEPDTVAALPGQEVNLVTVACAQVGYVREENGYTIYGDWAGDPYGDWATAFVGFCVEYAGVNIPTSTDYNEFIYLLEQVGLYHKVYGYSPVEGDIVFFADGGVGIVVYVDEYEIRTVEGGRADEVDYFMYALDDISIIGYCHTEE